MANKLVVKQIFGVSGNTRNALAFSQDHHIVYNTGAYVAVLNTESKEQGFIPTHNTHVQSNKTSGCTAIACSLPKKFIAVAERGEQNGIVVFYDSHSLRKKRLLNYPELGSKEYRCITFSDDGRYCLTQGAGPDWNLVLWVLEKNVKVVTTVKVSLSDDNPVNQVSFCPWDSTLAIAIGKGFVRIFRIVDGAIKSNPLAVRRENANFISHTWLPDDILLLGTEAGEILLVENNEYRGVIYPAQGYAGTNTVGVAGGNSVMTGSVSGANEPDELTPVYCLCPTPRGFVAGTVDGELRIFVRTTESREMFQLEQRKFVPRAMGKVLAVAVDSDDTLICTTDTQQIYSINLSSLNQAMENDETIDFEPLLSDFHAPNVRGEATITGMDNALWRPILGTVGKDKTLRLWNVNEKKMESMQEFEDEPQSLALHPSGLYAAVAFPERVQVLSLLLDGFQHCRDLNIRATNLVKFSHGGQFVACCSGTVIQIYHTYSGQPYCTLRGHTNRIRSLEWLKNDANIMSVGAEGASYFWEMLPKPTRSADKHDNILMPFTCGATPPDGSVCYLATQERSIREVFFEKAIDPATGLEGAARERREVEVGKSFSNLVYDDRKEIIIGGTCEEDQPGTLVTIQASPQLSHISETTTIHGAPISVMCQSYDKGQIFTGDINGVLIVTEFESSGKGGAKVKHEGINAFRFNGEASIKSQTLAHKKKVIKDLLGKVEELTLNNEHQLRLKEMDYKDRQKDISEKFDLQLRQERDKYDDTMVNRNESEQKRFEETNLLRNKFEAQLKGIDTKYKAKLHAEATRYKTLLTEVETTHRTWNEENVALVNSHQVYLKELCYQYETKIAHEQETQKRFLEEKNNHQKKSESERQWVEDDGEQEVIEVKSRFENRLKTEEATGIDLMAQHALVRKQLQNLTKDADNQKEDIRRMRDRELRLSETIRSLEKDIQSHKKEIREREETITDKEKRIFDLKKKNQELEKFRFVLDYKIRELKLQIEPREKETQALRRQSEEMTLELEQYHKSSQALELMLNELRLKADGLRKELKFQEDREKANNRLLEKFKADLREAWEVSNDSAAFKSKVVRMYRLYVQEDVAGADKGAKDSNAPDASDPQEIYNRDREQLERSLESLRRALKTEAMAHKRDFGKMMREGVVLTTELNTLRRDSRFMELQKSAIARAGGVGPKTNLPELMAVLNIELKKSEREKQKEIDDLKQQMQKGSTNGGDSAAKDILDALPGSSASRSRKSRSAALRTTSANGGSMSKAKGGAGMGSASDKVRARSGKSTPGSFIAGMVGDQWGAWKEIQMQNVQMNSLEDELQNECTTLGIDALHILVSIDANLAQSGTYV